MAKKFILIDPSIASTAGHYYEYAMHVLEAAQRSGFEPYLATHRRFAGSSHQSQWKTHAIYRYAFFASQTAAQSSLLNSVLGALGSLRFRWRLFYHFSWPGLLWAVRDRFGDFLLKQPIDRTHLRSLAFLLPLALVIKLLRLLVLIAMLPVMLLVFLVRGTARLLRAGGFPASYARGLLADAADALWLGRQILARRTDLLKWWQQYRCIRGFRRDTEALLRDVRAGEGDIVFLPTVSAIELMGLGDLLAARRPGPSWRLLFRRDLYRGREAGYAEQDARLNPLRETLLLCAGKLRGHDLRFYTDTDELTAQHNRLGVFHFETAPIPHTHAPRRNDGAARGPLRIIYVGDARREKGYHAIPRLVEELWDEYVAPGRVRFLLQSNFNVPRGEPEAVIARERLERQAARAPNAIELIRQPLTSEQYRDLLLEGDINLLLYDAENYYARSSGILVESLTAGIPVIVPAGSWLARQFRDPLYAWRHETAAQMRPSSPGAATHVLIETRFQAPTGEGVLRIGSQRRLLEGDANGEAVELVEAPDADAVIEMDKDAETDRFEVRWLAADNSVPRGTIGAVYHDESEIAGLMRDLIEHHAHYAATARAFAGGWREYHNAARLVAELAAAGNIAAMGARA